MLLCTNTHESSQQVYNSGKALGSELVPSTRGLSLSEPRALPKDWQERSRRKEPLQPGSHRGWVAPQGVAFLANILYSEKPKQAHRG